MIEQIAFYSLSAVVLFSALAVVLHRNTVHSSLFLGLSLAAVAGLFALLGADFLFAGQIMVSALLLRFAPEQWWLLFINGLNVPLLLLMFVAEYAIRRRRFPGSQSADIATMVRGLRQPRAEPDRCDAGVADRAAAPPAQGR